MTSKSGNIKRRPQKWQKANSEAGNSNQTATAVGPWWRPTV